jgi:hypothetical protein
VNLTWVYLSFWQLKHLEFIPFDWSLICSWDFVYSQSHHPWLSRQARFDVHAYYTSQHLSNYDLCNNHVTHINLSILVSLNSITKSFTKTFLIINRGHKILKILIIVWHLHWKAECHLHNYSPHSPSFISMFR